MHCTSFGLEAKIAASLRDADGPGPDILALGSSLGVSDDVVQQGMDVLASLNCILESGGRYKLSKCHTMPLPWEIALGLETKSMGRRVHLFDSLPSTQDYAIDLAKDADAAGSVVMALEQTRGRGRHRKGWVSPPGGIWMSAVLRPDLDVGTSTLLPAAVSVALRRAILTSLGIETAIRWPNDIMYGGGKVAGIIVDADIEAGVFTSVVVGVGVNFNVDIALVQDVIGTSEKAACLNNTPRGALLRFIRQFLVDLEDVTEKVRLNRTDAILSEWTRYSCTIGYDVPPRYGGGTAIRLDPDGALVVRQGSDMLRITADPTR